MKKFIQYRLNIRADDNKEKCYFDLLRIDKPITETGGGVGGDCEYPKHLTDNLKKDNLKTEWYSLYLRANDLENHQSESSTNNQSEESSENDITQESTDNNINNLVGGCTPSNTEDDNDQENKTNRGAKAIDFVAKTNNAQAKLLEEFKNWFERELTKVRVKIDEEINNSKRATEKKDNIIELLIMSEDLEILKLPWQELWQQKEEEVLPQVRVSFTIMGV